MISSTFSIPVMLRVTTWVFSVGLLSACAGTVPVTDDTPPFTDPSGIITSPVPTVLARVSLPDREQWVMSGEGVPLGVSVNTARGMTLSLNDQREFLIDKPGTVFVADDAGSFVILSPLNDHASRDWRLAFYDSDGKRLASNDSLHGFSRVAVAANGSTVAVVGTLKLPVNKSSRSTRQGNGLVIYDAAGQEKARLPLSSGTTTGSVAVNNSGSIIAVAVKQKSTNRSGAWRVRLFNVSGKELFSTGINTAVQGLRFADDDASLIMLVPGGIRELALTGKRSLSDIMRLPQSYYIAGSGRVLSRSGKILAVAEKTSSTQKGNNTWYLLAGDRGAESMEVLVQGYQVSSRRSPALSMSTKLGAKKWPVLVTTKSIMKIDLEKHTGK